MNWDLIGHDWACQLLNRHITSGKLRHAYLITGPQGIGRRTLALRFAQALNCTQGKRSGTPCLKCRTCTQINQMQHPDLIVVSADQRGSQIRVEKIRELQHALALTPFSAKYRIALILGFEDANINAANALLKILEEPPETVILILTAESTETLLPTIVSRCETLLLRPPALSILIEGLKKRFNLNEEQAKLLAYISDGHPGRAIKYLQSAEELERRKVVLDDFCYLLNANLVERFNYINSLSKEKGKIILMLESWQSFCRDILLKISGASIPIINDDYSEKIGKLASHMDISTVRNMLNCLKQTSYQIEKNVNTRLAMEILLLDIPMANVDF